MNMSFEGLFYCLKIKYYYTYVSRPFFIVKYLFEIARHLRRDLRGRSCQGGGQSTSHTHHVRNNF